MIIPLKSSSRWPLGDLELTLVDIKVSKAQSTTTQIATVTFEVTEAGPHKGKKFSLRYFLTERAEWKFRLLAAACDALDEQNQVNTDAIKGAIIRAEIRLGNNGEVVLIPRAVGVEA